MSNIRKSTSQFIDDAKRIHSDKYDYSMVEYVNTHTPIRLICKQCGMVFLQEPASHLAGRGCPKCAHKQTHLRINQEQFIEKAKSLHGDKYDYSKTVYVNMHTKIVITCPVHGIFSQNPQSHISGCGCPKCKRDKHIERITKGLPYFLERARKVHGDKYDYSKVEYVNSSKKVCIICAIHGEFWQRPSEHLKGCGCYVCANKLKGLSSKSNLNSFISKANEVHNNFYDYSLTEYKNSKSKVCIICPKHGKFWQSPNAHLHGYGCNDCGREKTLESHKKSTEEFIAKAKEVHGDKYDYSKVHYERNNRKVCIICPKHGEFWQSPLSHTQGNGCHKCKQTKGETKIEMYLRKHSIEYKMEHIFSCKGYPYKRRLFKVDFWIEDKRIIIEYNGIQHYVENEFMGGHKRLIQRQKRDEDLRDYSKRNNIHLIEIPFTDFNNIEKILDDHLK